MRARMLIVCACLTATIAGCAALDNLANGSDDISNAGRAQIDAASQSGPLAPVVAASGLAMTTIGAGLAAYKKWRDDEATKKAIRTIQNATDGVFAGIDLSDPESIAQLKRKAGTDAAQVERAISKALGVDARG